MKNHKAGRRRFLKAAVSTAYLPLAFGARPAENKLNSSKGSGTLGEPYELAGRRLVFLSWYYIRTGSFSWMDGPKKVGLVDAVEPGFAQFRRFDQPWGIRLAAQPAIHSGPLLKADRPWEEGSVALTTIIKDGGLYRGWGGPFTTSGNPPGQKHFYYLESHNGLNWTRPNVGVVDQNGSKTNNIVNIFGTDGGSIFIDPSAAPSERYKLIAEASFPQDVCDAYLRRRPGVWDPRSGRRPDGSATGLKGAVSADGLHWTQFKEPMAIEVTDTQLTGYYDERLRKYVIYTRAWVTGPRASAAGDDGKRSWQVGRRAIGRAESPDFRQFPLSETMLEPGPEFLPTDLLYTNAKTTIPGAPDHHLLFPAIWHTSNDSTSIALATSHDGKLWHFLPGSPVLDTNQFGAFDGGCIFAHPNLLELADGSFALPYTGYNVPHKYPRQLWKYAPGYALWPKGRIVALEAPERGEFTTIGLMPQGRKLRINAVTKRAGAIQVEIAGLDGKTVEGRSFAAASPISGDHYGTVLTWNGGDDIGVREKGAIMLRFRMEQAQIFGLEFV